MVKLLIDLRLYITKKSKAWTFSFTPLLLGGFLMIQELVSNFWNNGKDLKEEAKLSYGDIWCMRNEEAASPLL